MTHDRAEKRGRRKTVEQRFEDWWKRNHHGRWSTEGEKTYARCAWLNAWRAARRSAK